MISERFKRALKEISSTLDYKLCPWALIGSTNLALQGMIINPRDLDLVMRLKDLGVASKKFYRYNASAIEELSPDERDPAWTAKLKRCPAFNVHFNIKGVSVQILGEGDNGDYVSKLLANKLIYTDLKSFKIPCFTLETEAQVYDIFRPEKAQQIRDFLASQ